MTAGNCAVVAEVTGLSANAAASGVFIRQDLTSGGMEAAVLLKATGGITMASRTTPAARRPMSQEPQSQTPIGLS